MLLNESKPNTELKITHLNKKLASKQKAFREVVKQTNTEKDKLQKITSKFSLLKKRKQKSITKKSDKSDKKVGRLFVLDFFGDLKASAVAQLREEISLIITEADSEKDRVLVRLESPGGMVHGYGLASAQLARLRDAGFHLTICVDKVAASGGYMMACIANQIISAPFAIVGSIGVVAQMPNFNRLLNKLDVDFDVYTAGEFKRTITMFGKNDETGVTKFKEELEQTHQLFKAFVDKYRPGLNMAKVATGEHWFGEDALALHLIDQLETSDSYIMKQLNDYDVYTMTLKKKQSPLEKLGMHSAHILDNQLPNILFQLENTLKQMTLKG